MPHHQVSACVNFGTAFRFVAKCVVECT